MSDLQSEWCDCEGLKDKDIRIHSNAAWACRRCGRWLGPHFYPREWCSCGGRQHDVVEGVCQRCGESGPRHRSRLAGAMAGDHCAHVITYYEGWGRVIEVALGGHHGSVSRKRSR